MSRRLFQGHLITENKPLWGDFYGRLLGFLGPKTLWSLGGRILYGHPHRRIRSLRTEDRLGMLQKSTSQEEGLRLHSRPHREPFGSASRRFGRGSRASEWVLARSRTPREANSAESQSRPSEGPSPVSLEIGGKSRTFPRLSRSQREFAGLHLRCCDSGRPSNYLLCLMDRAPFAVQQRGGSHLSTSWDRACAGWSGGTSERRQCCGVHVV